MLWNFAVNTLASSRVVPNRRRWRLLKMLGLDVAHSSITPGSFFGSQKVSIGERTFVNQECFFDGFDQITIGADVAFGPRVTVLTSTHQTGPSSRRSGAIAGKPVTIGDGCWIGAAATILPGVTIGSGCVIAAGAVVTKDCAPDGLYAGVPARRVRDLDQAGTSDAMAAASFSA